jgi:hypothetical protein
MKTFACLLLFGLSAAFSSAVDAEVPATTNREIQIYYFHRTGRCATCLAMEKWTPEMAETLAAAEAPVRITMSVVNLDLPENEHYAKDFDITFNTVVFAEPRDDAPTRWKNLSDIWDFSRDEAAFKKFVESEFALFLDGAPSRPDQTRN